MRWWPAAQKWGETPLAYVELKPGATVTAEELIAHCKGLLAGYKVPREIRFEQIPKTATGKIQKFELRKRARSTYRQRMKKLLRQNESARAVVLASVGKAF